MERYSLIDLIEEDSEDELDESEQEDESKKRPLKLAEIILDFITKEKKNTEDETEILISLFGSSTEVETDEPEIITEDTETIVTARKVVENRIYELSKLVEDSPDDTGLVEDSLIQIKALEEIKDYLITDNQTDVEFEKEILLVQNDKEGLKDAAFEQVASDKKITIERPRTHNNETKITHSKKKHNESKLFSNNKVLHETKNHVTKRPIQETQKSASDVESITSTRELIKTLYEKKSLPKPENEIFKSYKSVNSVPKHEYIRREEANTFDIESIKKLLANNQFSNHQQETIIAEILAGNNPEKVIEKHLKNLSMHQFSQSNPDAPKIPKQITQLIKELSPSSNKQASKHGNKSNTEPLFNPRLIAIIFVLIVLMVILFRVI